jgi:hypothetical protein
MRQNPHGALIREDIRAELMRQLMSGREDLHQLYFGYAGHIKVMVSLFTQLTSTLPDDSIINRDAVLDKIHECSVHLDSNLKRIRSNVSNERANSSWLSCFSIISNAMRQLSDAIYLCTIIPVPITNPDIIREISRLSKYAECAAEILYQTIEESDLSSSWNENLQKEHKKYFATISDIIITSDAIVRSAQKRIYAKESLGNEGFMTVEISRLIRDSLQMLLSGSAYIRGQYWHHQLRPDLRFKFKNSQAQAGQVV